MFKSPADEGGRVDFMVTCTFIANLLCRIKGSDPLILSVKLGEVQSVPYCYVIEGFWVGICRNSLHVVFF